MKKKAVPGRELTGRVLKCAFRVHSELGSFYRESVYHRAMEVALTEEGLDWESEVYFPVEFRGVKVGRGFADIVVDSSVLLELKVCESLHPDFVSQMLQYLAAADYRLGYLFNFGSLGRLKFKRIIL